MLEKTLTEARREFSRIVADCKKNEVTVITVRGKPAAYLVSPEQFQQMKNSALEKEMEPIFTEFDSLFKALASK